VRRRRTDRTWDAVLAFRFLGFDASAALHIATSLISRPAVESARVAVSKSISELVHDHQQDGRALLVDLDRLCGAIVGARRAWWFGSIRRGSK
jgi:hypothetical protein